MMEKAEKINAAEKTGGNFRLAIPAPTGEKAGTEEKRMISRNN